MDKLGSEELWRQSEAVIRELDLDYILLRVLQQIVLCSLPTKWLCLIDFCIELQDIAAILPVNKQLLINTAAVMAPFSLDYTTMLLDQYMHLFCNTARLYLLLRFYPGRLIVQLYSLVHSHARLRQKTNRQQEQSDRNEMVQLIASGDNAVPLLQREFHQLTDRISQVSLYFVLLLPAQRCIILSYQQQRTNSLHD